VTSTSIVEVIKCPRRLNSVTSYFSAVPRNEAFITAESLSICVTYFDRHTDPFNGLFSRTAQTIWQQKGKTILDYNEARDDGVAVATAGLLEHM